MHRRRARRWRAATSALADGELTLLGLWGDAGAVHMALLDEAPATSPSSASTARSGRFPSVGALHPPAIRLERAIRDLFGLEPDGAAGRAALARSRPLGRRASARATRRERAGSARPIAFLPVEGESLHQIPVGPVHAGIIEPGHFRFTANGETVVRLEERLGYVHKGIEALMARRRRSSRRRSSPAAPPATARSPMRSPSRAPSRRRSASRCRRAPSGCAR